MKLVLTSKEFGSRSEESFSCDDTLYAYVTLPGTMAEGRHTVEASWFRPDGKRQDYTRTSVVRAAGDPPTAGFFLRFHPAEKSIFDGWPLMPSLQDRRTPFDGRWSLRVDVDSSAWLNEPFEVRCKSHE